MRHTPPRGLGVGVVLGEGDVERPPGKEGELMGGGKTSFIELSPDLIKGRGAGRVSLEATAEVSCCL